MGMLNLNIEQIITLLSGGSIVTIITIIVNQLNKKQETQSKSIDDRIDAWKAIAVENESRAKRKEEEYEKRFDELEAELHQVKLKLAEYNDFVAELQEHISRLEQIIIRCDPHAEFPKRPTLKK